MNLLDLTKQDNVVSFMAGSQSEEDWNNRCDMVKAANLGDYPSFWFSAIFQSGLYYMTRPLWEVKKEESK